MNMLINIQIDKNFCFIQRKSVCPLVAEEEVAVAVACQGVVAAVVAYQVVPSACHLHPSSAAVPVVDTVAAVLVSRIALVVLPGLVVEHSHSLHVVGVASLLLLLLWRRRRRLLLLLIFKRGEW